MQFKNQYQLGFFRIYFWNTHLLGTEIKICPTAASIPLHFFLAHTSLVLNSDSLQLPFLSFLSFQALSINEFVGQDFCGGPGNFW